MNQGLDIFKKAQHYAGGTNYVGPGSGEPTRRGIGMIGSITGNLLFPGLGFLTGPLSRGITHMIQDMLNNGASKDQIQQAVQQQQQQNQGTGGGDDGTGTPAPTSTTAPTQDKPPPSAGVGIDPFGNPADPGEWWSNDFGRWDTDKYGGFPGELGPNSAGGPGLSYGHLGTGFGSGTVSNFATAIGFGGDLGGGGPTGAGRYMGQGLNKPFTEAQYNAFPGQAKYPAPALTAAWGGVTQRPSYDQYLAAWHPPTHPAGAQQISRGTPMRQEHAMGTSDVNPGLKIFHKQQLKKPKQKEQIQ